jgi:ABC-type transport system substrate-binding protein
MNDPSQIVNYEMRGGEGVAYWARYYNPELNDKITAADPGARSRETWRDVPRDQEIFQKDSPVIWLGYTPATAGWRDYVEGFAIEALGYYRFENVRLNK